MEKSQTSILCKYVKREKKNVQEANAQIRIKGITHTGV